MEVVRIFLIGYMIVLALLIIVCLFRAIIGTGITNRVIGINMIGTMTISIIAVLAIVLKESYLLDICLIYAMISFLTIIILTHIYIAAYNDKKKKGERPNDSIGLD